MTKIKVKGKRVLRAGHKLVTNFQPLSEAFDIIKTPEKSGVLARHRGFEPLAFGSVDRRSIQLG